ncbi:MAG: response regulator, partial [Candidatus Zixiibacteriota bacterium]
MPTNTDRIVIIDDEQRMCDSLSALLRNDGYDVASFRNSLSAVDNIRANRVDLVITDIKMPEMDGLEILRQVKDIDSDIPVILMTGYASLDTALEAISRGAYDYLLKPVEFTYLSLAVRRALEKRRSELERLRLVEELKLSNLILQRRVGELNALYEAGKQIGSTVNLQELLRQIVVLAGTVTEARRGSIMLLDSRKEYLTIEAAIGLEEEIIRTTQLPIGASIAGYVAQTGEPLMVADVEQDPRFKRINQEKYGNASLLCVPLRIKNNILGVINLANKEGNREFTQDDLRLLTNFASQAAVAVDDASQFERNRRRLVEFEILHEMNRELTHLD